MSNMRGLSFSVHSLRFALSSLPFNSRPLLLQKRPKRSIHRLRHDLRACFIRVYSVALVQRVDSRYAVQEERNFGDVVLSREGRIRFVDRLAIFNTGVRGSF